MKYGEMTLGLSQSGIAAWKADHALALDFKLGRYRGSSNSPATPNLSGLPGYSYTRSGAKSELAASTGLVSFAANVPGIVPGVGYWSRGAVTNLVATSNPTAGATSTGHADPAGGTSAALYGGSGDQAITVATATTYTVTRFFKYYDNPWIRLLVFETAASANQARVWVNVQTGTLGSNSAAGTGFTVVGTPAITPVTAPDGSQWYRVQLSFQSSTATALTVGHRLANADGGTSATGTGIYVYQLQTVAGTQAGPIIVTTGATASTGADVLTLTLSQADEDFIMWGKVEVRGPGGALFVWNDTTANNRLNLFHTSGTAGAIFRSATVDTTPAVPAHTAATSTIAVMVRRRAGKFTIAVKSDDNAAVIGAEGAATAFPTLTSLNIGHQLSSSQTTAPVQHVHQRKGTFSDADCLAILEAA